MKISVYIVMFALIAACGNQDQENITKLKEEVMAVHDEVMPKMGEMMKLKKSLTALADSTQADSVKAMTYRQAASTIEMAADGMMNWMRNFKEPSKDLPSTERVTYYLQEKEKVQKVKEDMLSAIENAKKLLN